MTAFAQLIRAKLSLKSLPVELIEAGRLPGTTLPTSAVARTRFPRPVRAGFGLPASDLIADLSQVSPSSNLRAEFLPLADCANLGAVASVSPRAETTSYNDVPQCDLIPRYATFRNLQFQGDPAISIAGDSTGRRSY